MESRLWTFEDIKDATSRYEVYRDSDDPAQHYFYGVALEISGHSEDADEKFDAFRFEVQRKFGDLKSGAVHYEAQAEALQGGRDDERSSEHFVKMARILRDPAPVTHGRKCKVM